MTTSSPRRRPTSLGLFEGIGGITRGLEAALDSELVVYSEIDEYASSVLAARYPDATNLGDITTIDWSTITDEHGPIDIIYGGFPCQDLSYAGKGAGIAEGTRSGLWFSYADAIRELRPRLVVVENVAALLARGLDIVLGDLAACGYDAEWDCVPAAGVGAPHRRDRLFIVAYPSGVQRPAVLGGEQDRAAAGGRALPDADGLDGRQGRPGRPRGEGERHDEPTTGASRRHRDLPDADGPGRQGRRAEHELRTDAGQAQAGGLGGGTAQPGLGGAADGLPARLDEPLDLTAWPRPYAHPFWDGDWEGEVPRTAEGVVKRVDRLRCLGNAVVPQVAEHVARVAVERGLWPWTLRGQ